MDPLTFFPDHPTRLDVDDCDYVPADEYEELLRLYRVEQASARERRIFTALKYIGGTLLFVLWVVFIAFIGVRVTR
jgi:hypothetical protein